MLDGDNLVWVIDILAFMEIENKIQTRDKYFQLPVISRQKIQNVHWRSLIGGKSSVPLTSLY